MTAPELRRAMVAVFGYRIAAVAYSGLLGGPVAIGAAASGVGLRDALLIPAGLALLVAAAAGVLSPHAASTK